ncbi:MAG TPA: hypothetical protein VGG33_10520 [Polyangia bacterium]
MATRAETFRSEQARQRAHEAASQKQDNHGITQGLAADEADNPDPETLNAEGGGLRGSGHEGERGTGGREGRRAEQKSKDAIPLTVTQMHKTFAPSARHLKRT